MKIKLLILSILLAKIIGYIVKYNTCPLCGKPSPDGKEHPECMELEAALSDRKEK